MSWSARSYASTAFMPVCFLNRVFVRWRRCRDGHENARRVSEHAGTPLAGEQERERLGRGRGREAGRYEVFDFRFKILLLKNCTYAECVSRVPLLSFRKANTMHRSVHKAEEQRLLMPCTPVQGGPSSHRHIPLACSTRTHKTPQKSRTPISWVLFLPSVRLDLSCPPSPSQTRTPGRVLAVFRGQPPPTHRIRRLPQSPSASGITAWTWPHRRCRRQARRGRQRPHRLGYGGGRGRRGRRGGRGRWRGRGRAPPGGRERGDNFVQRSQDGRSRPWRAGDGLARRLILRLTSCALRLHAYEVCGCCKC